MFSKFECTVCHYIYDEKKGDPRRGIVPETKINQLPDDWKCPKCGAEMMLFKEVK